MLLFCQVILQNHVTERSSNFMERSLFRQVILLPSLVARYSLVVEIKIFRLTRDLARPRAKGFI